MPDSEVLGRRVLLSYHAAVVVAALARPAAVASALRGQSAGSGGWGERQRCHRQVTVGGAGAERATVGEERRELSAKSCVA